MTWRTPVALLGIGVIIGLGVKVMTIIIAKILECLKGKDDD